METYDELIATPFTDKLLKTRQLKLSSFHALPINRLKSLNGSTLKSKYQDLLGEDFADSEVTYTGSLLDTPVIPTGVLRESQKITAQAFGADATFYVTTGTSTSNYIAVLSSAKSNEKVLADRSCHQSIHFALSINKNVVDYSDNLISDKKSGRSIMNVHDFIEKYRTASERGDPYKLVILNGCSYEGIIYNIYEIISECLKINDNATFLVDEAWTAYGYFNSFYKRFSAMHIANELSKKYPKLKIIATQSAHKSLSSIRQASYIHIHAPQDTIDEIWKYKYMFHTTSPNYSILSTLELARAQMVMEGNTLICNTMKYSGQILAAVKKLRHISINEIEESKWHICDPCKLSINFSEKQTSISKIAEYLINSGIYANRKTSTSILFNIHIGITQQETDKLIRTLKKIDQHIFEDDTHVKNAEHYVIAYPPGTPVFLPGDEIEAGECERIKFIKEAGVSIIEI